jgi:hypothetical protein
MQRRVLEAAGAAEHGADRQAGGGAEQAAVAVGRVDRHGDGAELADGEQEDHELGDVAHRQGDDVAGADLEAGELAGPLVGADQQAAAAQGGVLAVERALAARARDGVVEPAVELTGAGHRAPRGGDGTQRCCGFERWGMASEPERVADGGREHEPGSGDAGGGERSRVAGARGAGWARAEAEEGEVDVHAELVVAARSH